LYLEQFFQFYKVVSTRYIFHMPSLYHQFFTRVQARLPDMLLPAYRVEAVLIQTVQITVYVIIKDKNILTNSSIPNFFCNTGRMNSQC